MIAMLLTVLSLFSGYTVPEETGITMRSPYSIEPDSINSDSIQYVQVGKIIVVGNRKTKESIILREMSVKTGDAYEINELALILEQDRKNIMNTRLFNTVAITILPAYANVTDILIEVHERWYFFPIPIFSLADRNLNDWIQNQGADWSRVSYGVKVYKNNSRGRNERLRLDAQFGYTKRFLIQYQMPYIDKRQRHGLDVGFQYAENKNVGFRTVDHLREFLDSENVLRRIYTGRLGYTFRNNIYIRHGASLSYNNVLVADTIVQRNPEFFNNADIRQKYFSLTYTFSIDHRDFQAYPLNGHYFQFTFIKDGLWIYDDVDKTEFIARYTNYFNLGKEFYLSNYSSAYVSTPGDQPYSQLAALGYRADYVRGYELELIEGQHLLLNRTTFKKKILGVNLYAGFMPAEQFRRIPFAIFLKTYFDMGYVRNYDFYEAEGLNTRLSNKYLFGTGLGVDIVTFYDLVVRLEYSMNAEKETGFFFNFKKEF